MKVGRVLRGQQWRHLAALAGVVALGLASRLHPIGLRWFDKDLGDVLYAAAAYLVLALFRPRWRPDPVAAVALAFCLAVETFQLTGLPARWAHVTLVRWLLGTGFAWRDVACYVVGIGGVTLADRYSFRSTRTHSQP
jgi:hypothetical protein